jgi:hypothetical protein
MDEKDHDAASADLVPKVMKERAKKIVASKAEKPGPGASKSKISNVPTASKRGRVARIYPALTFQESLLLADAIHMHASGEKVSRLTLVKAMNISPTSSATQILITSSGKYAITRGSFSAEHIELTPKGRVASDPHAAIRARTQARFDLAIKQIVPFDVIYQRYKGKKLPSHEVMRDVLNEASLEITDANECIDTFVVNAKFIGLLQTIAGSETLVPIETLIEQLPAASNQPPRQAAHNIAVSLRDDSIDASSEHAASWDSVCFYITPIGDEDTEHRKHSDLFLGSLIEPALNAFGLNVVRADRIAQPGMITSQVLEHILRARLVIADLSYHNPNVFYEMALRHATRLPIVQICRRADKLPFDVNQVRTISIDTTDIYTLIPKLETYRSEIASQVRAALDGQVGSNPISVFFPSVQVTLPS